MRHAMEGNRRSIDRLDRATSWLLVLGLFAVFTDLAFACAGPNPGGAISAGSAAASTTPRQKGPGWPARATTVAKTAQVARPAVEAGIIAVLSAGGAPRVSVCRDPNMAVINPRLADLVWSAPQCFSVPAGTRVLLLRDTPSYWTVDVVDGPWMGWRLGVEKKNVQADKASTKLERALVDGGVMTVLASARGEVPICESRAAYNRWGESALAPDVCWHVPNGTPAVLKGQYGDLILVDVLGVSGVTRNVAFKCLGNC